MSRLIQTSLFCLLLPCTILTLAGCEQKSESPSPAADAPKPATTAAQSESPASAEKPEPQAPAPPPTDEKPQPPVPAPSKSEPAAEEKPVEPAPPQPGSDSGPASDDDVEWVAEGAWRAPLNSRLDECGQLLEQLGATEAEHDDLLNKFRGDVQQVLPLYREMSDNVAKVKDLAGTGKTVTVGDKTYGPPEMQDLASRSETTLARVNEWSDLLHQRTGDAAVMRSLVRSGRDTLTKLRNQITTIDRNLSFLQMLEGAPLPQREGEEGAQSVNRLRTELLRETGQQVHVLQQSADQLKSDVSGGAVPPLDMKAVETQPTIDALNALQMEMLALLEKAS